MGEWDSRRVLQSVIRLFAGFRRCFNKVNQTVSGLGFKTKFRISLQNKARLVS